MSIKGIVFDYGKVITLDQAEDTMEKLASIAGIDAGTMENLVWGSRAEFDRGTIRGKDYYRGMLKTLNIEKDDAALRSMVEIDMGSWTRINGETVKLMEDIKALGIRLGILSNMPHDFLALHRGKLDVFRLPEISVFSCNTGFIKPEKEIYEILIREFGCKAEELAFFDDIQKNVDGARMSGIHAFLWTDAKAGRKALRDLGLQIKE